MVTKRFYSEVANEEILFHIDDSNRLDSGKYKITAENEFGSDSGFLHVTVIDRPDPPVGPVVYTNIDRETIKLEWKVPEDDGGSDIRYNNLLVRNFIYLGTTLKDRYF